MSEIEIYRFVIGATQQLEVHKKGKLNKETERHNFIVKQNHKGVPLETNILIILSDSCLLGHFTI